MSKKNPDSTGSPTFSEVKKGKNQAPIIYFWIATYGKGLRILPQFDFRSGKENVIGFLIGAVQKELKGKGDPKLTKKLLLVFLKKSK